MNYSLTSLKAKVLPIVLASLILGSILGMGLNGYLNVQAKERIVKPELRFELLSLPWFPQSDKAAEIIAKQLEKVGIKLEIRRVESSIMYPKVENFEHEAHILATSQSPNPMGMIETFHSSRARPGIGSFWCHEDPEVDRLIESIRSETDPRRLKEMLYALQEKLAKEAGFIPIYLTMSTQVLRAEWKNYTVMPGGPIEAYNIWSLLYMYKSEKPEENVFRIAFPSDIMTTNPFMAYDLRSLWVINLIYDPLLRLDKDLQVVPWLAESWEVSDDGLTYTFHLRRDVKWHDGTPFTADDVVFTFGEGMRQETTRFIGLKDIIESVEKVDEYTVRFKLKTPYPFFLLELATGYYYIVPKHIAEGVDLRKWENPEPIGTGPFKWVERVIGEYIVLVRNEDFWIKGVPKITKVIVKVIPEAESRFLAIKNGEVDTERYDTAVTLLPRAKEDPNLRVITAPGLWLIYVAFNTYNHFYDPKVFLAIHYAINRTEVVEKANAGYGYPVYTILNRYWHGEYAAPITFEYNPEKAKQLLEEAGWKDIDGDGIREYVGPTTTTPTPTETVPVVTSPTPLTPGTVTVTQITTATRTETITIPVATGGVPVELAGVLAAIIVILLIAMLVVMRRR